MSDINEIRRVVHKSLDHNYDNGWNDALEEYYNKTKEFEFPLWVHVALESVFEKLKG